MVLGLVLSLGAGTLIALAQLLEPWRALAGARALRVCAEPVTRAQLDGMAAAGGEDLVAGRRLAALDWARF